MVTKRAPPMLHLAVAWGVFYRVHDTVFPGASCQFQFLLCYSTNFRTSLLAVDC